MARYKYYPTPGPRVICVSSYGGRKVRGVAVCSESDEYDLEKGKALAKARVDLEIARRRLNRASEKHDEALNSVATAKANLADMRSYLDNSLTAFRQAEKDLADLLNTM